MVDVVRDEPRAADRAGHPPRPALPGHLGADYLRLSLVSRGSLISLA